MSTSRAESQAPQFGRRRSNTAQSIYKNAPLSASPLKFGDSKTLTTWVHEVKDSPDVILNPARWPGVADGDMLRLSNSTDATSGFLFIVNHRDEGLIKHQLQISVPRPVAKQFGLRNNGEVRLTKIDKTEYCADFIELTFQDQYLGRNEMWRLGSHLVGQCVYMDQEISFIGVIAAKVQAIYVNGKKVSAAYVTSSTKEIYRSLSAKVTIFIQVCRELCEFAGDGERYNEKIVHSFLPALFSRWRESSTNHIVTIVLISRVFYDKTETEDAAGPLRKDEDGRWYKDFFKVITDLEVLYDWKPTLIDLKNSFWAFQRDILLAHHYHRASLLSQSQSEPNHVRLVGQLSYAHDGPLLEALNLGLNPTETHYIDRSLSLTGSSTIVITPGTGYFRVSKQLLRLTTTRLLDQGFGVELVSLTKPPLHLSPIFSFQGVEPEASIDSAGKIGSRSLDPLWGGDEAWTETMGHRVTFWWEPFWMAISFWDKQMDLPFREDRFVARAKMHEIEMLGLLDHDVLSNIEIPFLPGIGRSASLILPNISSNGLKHQEEADTFDKGVFSGTPKNNPPVASRNSLASVSSAAAPSATSRFSAGVKRSSSTRTSDTSIFSVIEESPRYTIPGSPGDADGPEVENKFLSATYGTLSTSPSQSSMRSVRSTRSQRSATSIGSPRSLRSRPTKDDVSEGGATARSRFTPSWLFGPFRRVPSQPQTSEVSVSSNVSNTSSLTTEVLLSPVSKTALLNASAAPTPRSRSPQQILPSLQSVHASSTDAGPSTLKHDSPTRRSPIKTTTLHDSISSRRRTLSKSSTIVLPVMTTSPSVQTNPSMPLASVPYTQSSLARRWQHMFPRRLAKHEIKWKAMIMPGCLPLTTDYFPTMSELETSYDVFSYDFVIDPPEMRSFLVKPPIIHRTAEEARRAWALVVMRGMVALRLAQGFQFVLRPSKSPQTEIDMNALRRSRSYVGEDDTNTRPVGLADVLESSTNPVYLSMSNEIHRVAYSGDSIQVRRFVRRMPRTQSFDYQCLIWPKLGVGYTELSTSFVSHGLESYGWNRLDMLVAGYESQFNESIRYWRTRFVVIPTDEPPSIKTSPTGEKLDDEEARLLGMDKLAELFSKARWYAQDDRGKPAPPVRFLTTDLDPASCVLDDSLTAQLDEIHATGPLKKKAKSERDIAEMSLAAIAKAMREEDGVSIKDHRWHGRKYANSFTGSDFVSWLVREFRDVSSREQGAEWGARLQEKGLFDHCRGTHGFLDGHYFYILRGEYLVPMTPRSGWFRSGRLVSGEEPNARLNQANADRTSISGRKPKKRLILSQSTVIDVDPSKRSDQAESVILHHDIIHNPATCFHFELQWIGTTARYIDDLLRQWSRTIERYGLKLVEAYVTQICDIRDRNPFQSCFPLPLAVPPPIIPDLDRRVPEGVLTKHYFEYAILRKHGFVLDIEAAALYPEQVDVVYSYRRSPFKFSQWVHRSGVAFVQVLGGSDGFLFLTNRLMAPSRIGLAPKYERPAFLADSIRVKLQNFCSDKGALMRFYDGKVAQLEYAPDDPPPLHI